MNCVAWRGFVIVASLSAQIAWSAAQEAPNVHAGLSKEQVLERWAEALGGREPLRNVAAVHLRARIETGGMKGTYERWTTSRGELRTAVDLSGAYRRVNVFDGREAWTLDNSGAAHEIVGETFKALVSVAYEASESYLFPDRIPGHVELVNETSRPDTYVLRLEPQNGVPLMVYLDSKTFLPQREETSGPMGSRIVTLSDWHSFGGVNVPRTVRQSTGDPKFDAVITTEQVEINPPITAELFSKPGEAATRIEFAPGGREAVLPANVYGDHIFLPVNVNGREGASFFLDSGAGMSIVSDAWAQNAGLTVDGTIGVKGTGAATASVGLAKNVVLEVAGARVPPATIAVWDLAPIQSLLGRKWDGVLGYDVISRLVVLVDYEHQQITLRDPGTFVPNEHATVLPVTFLGNMPMVHAKIVLPGGSPVDAECAIDSGADGFHLTAPFTNANHVLDSLKKKISASTIGAGGESKQYAGRISGLQLGPHLLKEPIVTFSPNEKEGLFASPDIDALIGGGILKRFTVTFDFPHRRMFLEPNSHFSDPFLDNESGLSLRAKGTGFHTFEVDAIEPGSPTDLAGVHKGDVLAAIDKHSTSDLDLAQIDKMLQPGRTVALTILRGGRTLRVRLKLDERL